MKKLLLLALSITLIFAFNPDAYAQFGKRVKVNNNNELSKALSNPNVGSIEIGQDGFYDELLKTAVAGTIVIKGGGNGDRDQYCGYTINPSNVCFDYGTTWTANVAEVYTTFISAPGCPPDNDPDSWGWSVEANAGNINLLTDIHDYLMPFEVDAPGSYTLRYTWDQYTSAQTEYFFFGSPAIIELSAPPLNCGLETDITFEYDAGTPAPPGTHVIWEVSGPGGYTATFPQVEGPTTFDFTAATCGAYTVTATVSNTNGCSPASATINMYFFDEPENLNAGADDEICALTYGLSGSFDAVSCDNGTLPTVLWSVESGGTGTFVDATANATDFTADACGPFTFKYQVTNGECVTWTFVDIYFYDDPVPAITGLTEVCGLAVTLDEGFTGAGCDNGNAPIETWTPMTGVTFTDNGFGATDITVPSCGAYTFTYTVQNGSCTSYTTHDVYFYNDPVTTITGPAEVCGLAVTLDEGFTGASCANGVNPVEEWTVISGVTFTDNGMGATNITVLSCGAYTFTYTVTNGECVSYTTHDVYFYDTPTDLAIAGPAEVCGLEADLMGSYTTAVCPGGGETVAWTQVSGTGTAGFVPADANGTHVTVNACGAYTFKFEVTNGECVTWTTHDIYFSDVASNVTAGSDQDICGLVTTLEGSFTNPICMEGPVTVAWTMLSGTGTVSSWTPDATTSTTGIEVTTCGAYTFMYEVFNGSCSVSATVDVYFYDTPAGVDAGPDQEVCGLEATLDGDPGSVQCGTVTEVLWTKFDGPGAVTFDTEFVNGPDVTVTMCGLYTFEYTVSNGPCSTSSMVDVYFYDMPLTTTMGDNQVCGMDVSLSGDYDVDCDNEIMPLETWTYVSGPDPTPSMTVTGLGMVDITVTTCGEYVFEYTVVNGECTSSTLHPVHFYETPNPVIDPMDDPYTCSTVTYTATNDVSCGNDDIVYVWTVNGGMEVTSTWNTITVDWGQMPGSASIEVFAFIDGPLECAGEAIVEFDLQIPTFEGQVKYWNEFETYMPTPFPTDFYGTFPEDYFYVTLYLYNGPTSMTQIEWVKVQPRLDEDLNELMSYFTFDLNTAQYGCEAQYVLKIWDGGLYYHPNPPTVSETYLGGSYTYTNWGGVNATDALAIQMMANLIDINPLNGYSWVGLVGMVPDYGYYSYNVADVNNTDPVPFTTGGITALDALTAKYRTVGLLGSYPDNGNSSNQFAPNFSVTGRMVDMLPQMTFPAPFDYPNPLDVPFTHSGNDYLYFVPAVDHQYTSDPLPWEGKANYINLYYEAIGDVNASYVPTSDGFKAQPDMDLIYEGVAATFIGEEMTIPVSIDRDAELGAITLAFNYRNDLVEVLSTNWNDDDVFINHEEGILNMAWFSTEAIDVDADASIALVTVRILAEIPENTELFHMNANTELADATANPIQDINLKTIGVTTDKGLISVTELTSSNYPNPFKDATTISYILPENGKVTVEVYNNVGMKVITLVEEAQEAGVQNVKFNTSNIMPGVYIYHITVQGETNNYSAVKRMIVVN